MADHKTLANAVADNLVIAADPAARGASATWWEDSRKWTAAVAQATLALVDQEIRLAGERLLNNPIDPKLHAEMVYILLKHDPVTSPITPLFKLAWEAECNSRLGYHLGSRYNSGTPLITADSLRTRFDGSPRSVRNNADVLIVIPFRDRGDNRLRLRNLLACLLALRDQSYPSSSYRVTVVEADDRPRWGDLIIPYADNYLFAEDPGQFNKSWAVNVGVVHSSGIPEVICILDGDVLADRNFIARNAARFHLPGTGGHLPYRDMLCLDSAASSLAIDERLSRQTPAVDLDQLRGFVLRRPPGCCVWVRAAAFYRISGMDERYRGWGGEDYDFTQRLSIEVPVDAYNDPLLHLYHPPAAMPVAYHQSDNARIPSLSWRPTEPIGRLDRFARRDNDN